MEYLSCPGLRGNGLINNLSLRAGFMTTFVESGVCWGCYQLQELVSFFILFLFHIIKCYFSLCSPTLNPSSISLCLAPTKSNLLTLGPSCSLHLQHPCRGISFASSQLCCVEQECFKVHLELFMEKFSS